MTPQQAFKDHPLQLIAKNIVILGAVALFFIGIQQKNYISTIFGEHAQYVYILIGLAGVFLAYKEAMWIIYPQSTQVTTTPA
jgi:uncharacterized membrane protein YuzA (DUF378 family)